MELIRISNCKMKIMLTPSDMSRYELDFETFGEDSGRMHRAFRHLLDDVRKRTGFEADDNRISVQYFPSREGGCEMFISHIDGVPGEPPALPSGRRRGAKDFRGGESSEGVFFRELAYRFRTAEELLAICRRLAGLPFSGESSTMRDEKGRYYLILRVVTRSPFSTPEEYGFLTEYGSAENVATLKIYIREHGETVVGANAVAVLGNL